MQDPAVPNKTDTVNPAVAAPAAPVVDPLTKVIPSARVLVTNMDELQPVLDRHQRWIDSVLSPKVDVYEGRANLAGSDLSGLDLTGVNLSGATLTGCRLVGTLFRNANLRGVNFSQVDAQGADFRGARLQKANFERADLRGAEWEGANLTGTEFKFARRVEKAADESNSAEEAADSSADVVQLSAEIPTVGEISQATDVTLQPEAF